MTESVDELRRRLERAEAALRERTEELALMRLHLDALALVDPVTGMLNERGIDTAIDQALQRLSRLDEPFSATAVRIHALEIVDDAHAADALRHVAALLRAGLRALDAIGRVDASTFVIVSALPGNGDHTISLSRVRSIMSAAPLDAGKDAYEVEPRFGVVLARPGCRAGSADIRVLMERALHAAGGEPVTLVA